MKRLSVCLSVVLVSGCFAGEDVNDAASASSLVPDCVILDGAYVCDGNDDPLGCLTHPTTCKETVDPSTWIHNVIFQMGTVTYGQSAESGWGTVTFTEPFSATPIVVMGPPSSKGASPVTVRIKNVTSTGFHFLLDEWDYLDGYHPDETFSFIAVLPGAHTWGGLTVQAGAVSDVTHVAKSVSFASPFTASPIVLVQAGTYREASAVTTRLSNVSSAGFQVRVQEEEANVASGHEGEVIHYLALSTGSGDVAGKIHMTAGRTGTVVTDAWSSVWFGASFSGPKLFASLQTSNDETAALRYRNLLSGSVELKAEEEQSLDAETTHAPEAAGFLVIGQ